MKVIFLGTNGWYDTTTGNTVCILVETSKEYVIFDAGNGIYKLDRYIKTTKPTYLFLSHFHLDHIIGLHILAKFNFPKRIEVYGPKGTLDLFAKVINQPYTMPIRQLKTEVRLHELDKRTLLPINIEFGRLTHSSPCYGYRFYSEDKIISYCTDTCICKNLFILAKNADLLITECSFKPGKKSKKWPHLNPEQAALVAKKAVVKRLALTHFDASIYKTSEERKQAERIAQRVFKNTFAVADEMEIEI